MPPGGDGAELGLLAPGRRARVGAPHGLLGQRRVAVGRCHLRCARGQRVKALERGLAHDEVARQVIAIQRHGAQHVVVAPVARVVAQLQRGVGMRKGAPHEALGPHVVQKPGQAVVPRTHAVGLVHPEGAALQRHQACKRGRAALRVDAHHPHLAAHAGHVARQHIALRARRAHLLHLACMDQRRQRARHRGLAHAQQFLQLGAGQHAPLAAQGRQGFGGEFMGGGHE